MVYRPPFNEEDPKLFVNEAATLLYACQNPDGIHGYDLARELGQDVTNGTTYRMLGVLKNNGLFDVRIEDGCGPSRKVHTITEKGREVLERYFYKIIES